MDSNETVETDSRKMEHVDVVADATCFSQTTHASYEPGDDEETATTTESEGICLSSTRDDPSRGTPRDPNLYYDMSGNKYLIVFNHYEYNNWRMEHEISGRSGIQRLISHSDKRSLFQEAEEAQNYVALNCYGFGQPSVRKGTAHDVTSLEETFRDRGFVVETHNDCTHEEIKRHLSDLCKKNHSNTSCLAVAVMTHGIDTYLSAADTLYPLTDITEPVQAVPSLANKPKLFFIQACREKHIQPLRDQKNTDVPIGADCLYLYSTYRDHVAFRDRCEGAWMMQSLCKVIKEHHSSLHLMQMVKRIKNMVAKKDALLVLNPGTFAEKREMFKQTPVTENKLKKYLMI